MNLKPASQRFFQSWSAFKSSQIYLKSGPFNLFNVRHSSLKSLSENDLAKNTRSIFRGLMDGERWALAKAITLIESTNKVNSIHWLTQGKGTTWTPIISTLMTPNPECVNNRPVQPSLSFNYLLWIWYNSLIRSGKKRVAGLVNSESNFYLKSKTETLGHPCNKVKPILCQ